jgi:hypothetical protein
MGRFSDMIVRRPDPAVRLSRRPRQILDPLRSPTPTGWGPAPTGYYPNVRDEHHPPVRVDYPMAGYADQELPIPPSARPNPELIDQHPWLQANATVKPPEHQARQTMQHDPVADGLPAPVLRIASVWRYTGYGVRNTHYLDVPDGRAFPKTGSQDGSSTINYQDPGAALATYNVPASAYDPQYPERSTSMPDTLRQIPAGPSHGWSEVPVAPGNLLNRAQTARLRQQKAGRQDRLANSLTAGQTYSQSTQHVGSNRRPVRAGAPGVAAPGSAGVPG